MIKTRWLAFVFAALLAVPAPGLAQSPQVQAFLTSASCPGTGCVTLGVSGLAGVAVQITGTFTGTLTFEVTLDGVTYTTVNMTPPNSTTAVTTATAAGIWGGAVGGASVVRVRMSSYTSGTAAVTIKAAPMSGRGSGLGGGGGGGGLAGTIADTQVAYGTGVDTIGGSANFVFGGVSQGALTVTGTAPGLALVTAANSGAESHLYFRHLLGGSANDWLIASNDEGLNNYEWSLTEETDFTYKIEAFKGTAGALKLNQTGGLVSIGPGGLDITTASSAGGLSFNGIAALFASGNNTYLKNGFYTTDNGIAFSQFAFAARNDVGFAWYDTDPGGSIDTKLSRSAAGVVEVNNGTVGTFRDLKSRQLIAAGSSAGAASTTTYTNATDTTVTNAYIVKGGQAATTVNTGWIKVFVGTAAAWIPYWANATP